MITIISGTKVRSGEHIYLGPGISLGESLDGLPYLNADGTASTGGFNSGAGTVSVHFHASASADLEIINFPSAFTPLFQRYEWFVTSAYTRARLVAHMGDEFTASAGSKLYAAFSKDDWVTWQFLDGSHGPFLEVDGDGILRGAFVDMIPEALGDVQLGIIAAFGDDDSTSVFKRVTLELSGPGIDEVIPGVVTPNPGSLPPLYTDRLEIWLKADEGVTYDGSNNITDRWEDQVGVDNGPTLLDSAYPRYRPTALNGRPAVEFSLLDSEIFSEDFESYVSTPGLLADWVPDQNNAATATWTLDSTRSYQVATLKSIKLSLVGFVGAGTHNIVQYTITGLRPSTTYNIAYRVWASNFASFPLNQWYEVTGTITTDVSGVGIIPMGTIASGDATYGGGNPLEWWFDAPSLTESESGGFEWLPGNNPRSEWAEAHMFALLRKVVPNSAANSLLFTLGTDSGNPSVYGTFTGSIEIEYGTTTRRLATYGHTSATAQQYAILEVITAPNNYKIRLDGVDIYTSVTNTVSFPSTGALAGQVGSQIGGFQLAEWLEYSEVKDDATAQRIRDYLRAKKDGVDTLTSPTSVDTLAVTPNLIAWHLGDKGRLVDDGDNIITWQDLSGNNNSMRYHSGNYPQVAAGDDALNGRATLRFDHSTFRWDASIFTGLQALEGLILVKSRGTVDGLWRLGAAAVPPTKYSDAELSDNFASSGRQGPISFSGTLTEYRLYNVRSGPINWIAALDFKDLFTTPNDVEFSPVPTFGESWDTSPGNFEVAEVVLYGQILTTSQRAAVTESISSRWGLDIPTGITQTNQGGSGTSGGTSPGLPTQFPPGTRRLGLFNIWPADIGKYPRFGSTVFTTTPANIYTDLEKMRNANMKVFLSLATRNQFTNADGTFNYNLFAQRVAAFAGKDIRQWITDGTVIGIYVIDEPFCSDCFGDVAIPNSVVDSLGALVKNIFPYANTYIRASSLRMKGQVWQHIDGCWNQYPGPLHGGIEERRATMEDYIRDCKSEAINLGLRCVWGINLLDGGDSSSGIHGYGASPTLWQCSPEEVLRYGRPACLETYSDGVVFWSANGTSRNIVLDADYDASFADLQQILSTT